MSSEGTPCPSGQTERIKVLITLGNREEGGTKKEREKGERRRGQRLGGACQPSITRVLSLHLPRASKKVLSLVSHHVSRRQWGGGRRGVEGGNAAFGGSSVRAGNGEGRKTPCAARNLTSPCEAQRGVRSSLRPVEF